MFALEVKQNPAGDAFEIEKGNGDVRDCNIRTAAAVVLYDTSKYSLYVLQSRASRSRCSIPGVSGRVDMLTSPVPAARAAVATGAWVESKKKHDMILIHTSVEVWELKLNFYPSAGG